MQEPKIKQSFSDFTSQYELTKTLRFELKSLPSTKSLIEVVEKDKEIDRLYNEEMKPMFDDLHEKFITEALSSLDFSINDLRQLEKYFLQLKELKQTLKKFNKNKKDNKKRISDVSKKIKELEDKKSGEISKLQSRIRDTIVEQFTKLGNKWKEKYEGNATELTNKKGKKININLKGAGIKILEEKNILALLAHHNPKRIVSIKEFVEIFTYFKGFNRNRANYYTSDQKATGVANRIININLNIFIKNKQDFGLFLSKLSKLEGYKKYFELGYFKSCLTQAGIEDYNEIVGKVKSTVNLEYNQKVDKKDILKGLNKLQKQIGCKTKQQREQIERGESIYPKYLEKVGLGFHITKNEDDNLQVWECLDYLNKQLVPQVKKLRENYNNFFTNWLEYQLDEIWFSKESLNTISGKWFGGSNWFVLTRALAYSGVGKMEKGEYKPGQFASLQELKGAMEVLERGVDFDVKRSRKNAGVESGNEDMQEPKQYFYKPENLFRDEYKDVYQNKTLFEAFLEIWKHELEFKFTEILDGYVSKEGKQINSFLQNFKEQKQTFFNKSNNEHIKVVFDLMQEGYLPILRMTRYHSLEKKGEIVPGYNTDGKFYDALNEFWEENPINQYRTAFQATLTQKPYSEEKIKLNFDCGYLLGGWAISYDTYGALIFEKDNRFYLCLINGTGLNEAETQSLYKDIKEENLIKRLAYNAQKLDFKNCPRWFINSIGDKKAPAVEKYNLPIDTIWDDYQSYRKLDQKGKAKYLEDNSEFRYRLIDYYKYCLPFHEDLSKFKNNFSWKETKDYENLDDFYTDAVNSCYKISWENVNFDKLRELAKKERIYLFQIYNKDFELDSEIGKTKYGSDFKTKEQIRKEKDQEKGQTNIHTQIFLELLKPENTKYLKLLGGGEIFFREPSKEKHYRTDNQGKKALKAPRYYEEKYFLHFPVEIKKQKSSEKALNQSMLELISQNKESIKIIGIDRGEKHLMYYSVISVDEDGNTVIEDQGSFNKIEVKNPVDEKKLECEYNEKGKLKKVELVPTGRKVNYVDYHLLLDYYEKKRDLARKSWEAVGKIKDLKEGYLSQAIHKLYNLILKHEAIVVMEDLNTEFKAKRGAEVEKSIYKKFELKLAKKLNHLILKDKKPLDDGGVLKPYQLTPLIKAGKIDVFEKAKQWGIIFYVQPHYTSTTDPLTGWRKHLYISNSAPIEKRQSDKSKAKKTNTTYIKDFFDPKSGVQINYDFEKSCFKFNYKDQTGKPWDLYAYEGLERFYYDNQSRSVKPHNLYDEFESLFSGLKERHAINKQILALESFNWKTLVFLWNLLNQIRNTDKSKESDENDFIQSPCWSNKYQCFFDSRKLTDKSLPTNGDANGAYNIARKGYILLEKIKEHAKNDPQFKKPPNLFISNQEWDEAVSDWGKYVQINSS